MSAVRAQIDSTLVAPAKAGAFGRRWALPTTAAGVLVATLVVAGFAAAAVVRFWQIDALGYNSDEAVYAGQGASIANHELKEFFPTFRAHPLLFQVMVSFGFHLGAGDVFGRLLAAVMGIATIALVYLLGKLLYGRRAGVIAALLIALMPYHVLVSRQVLLDGPMTFYATLTLYLIARFAMTGRAAWLYAAGGAMGLTVLAKETSILIVGAIYAFLALSPDVRTRIRDVAIALAAMIVVVAHFPLSLRLAGRQSTGEAYLAYQLFRRPNHEWSFYPATVPMAIGPAVVVVAAIGLWLLRDQISWRETLLLAWIVVPCLFFQLWPVKGYQYLLPTAPAFALLAGRTLASWQPSRLALRSGRQLAFCTIATAFVAATLAVPSWSRIQPSKTGTFLAGSGGLPGGREVGAWIRANVPEGARFLTIGPSMANVVQFYGRRKAYGLSVGTNPLRRNPAYEPIPNPDLAIRTNELQYIVWDAFSASRSHFFSEKLLRYVDRYNGRVVRTVSTPVTTADGRKVRKPLILVYEVRP